jgi:hypothetical protein
MSSALDSKIAQLAATRVCRFCSQMIAPEAVICACRIARGELPHTEWPKEVKRLLCVRTIESLMWPGTSEQDMWERRLQSIYAGTTQGAGVKRIILPMSASVVECFPLAAGDASLWSAAGYPTLYTI